MKVWSLLRAITYFEDAEAEARLPGEGSRDWDRVKSFFVEAAGALITPPNTPLEIQRRVVGLQKGRDTSPPPIKRPAKTKKAKSSGRR